MDVSLDKSQPRYFVNPVVLEKKNEIQIEQVCLSFPGCMIVIPRFNDIKLSYFDKNGEQKIEAFSGIEAACIQHQVELLNGILFIDHLSKLKRERFLKKYESERQHGAACHHGCSHD